MGKDGCGGENYPTKTVYVKLEPKNDVQIAWDFFEMLKRNGVSLEYTSDNGQGFKILAHCSGNETIEVCFYPDGKYWRIMGTDSEGFYSDDIHKDGWK